MKDKTFAIIKPDAVNKGYTGKIYDRILKADFNIIGAKLLHMTPKIAKEFYSVHKEKPFFNDLIHFMTSGPSMVLALQKENAVQSWRNTIGATNPEKAAKDTIRKDFASNVQENAVHGSDSDENAQKEIAFFFIDSELLSN
ncbi:MAG: nucleoside-diphosphate kinase [Candidatus Marinimicrobia bacterium]|nr:nucleoside-diphosphate kinase [Candidatus Neomarinimicrobiota bacterium]|tara:strand:- start:406 stop:828 length:423 start_codon:yes stop_codon:yes gene_type:complete